MSTTYFGWTQSSVMDEVEKQLERRLSIKYNWKRIPHSIIERLEKKIGKLLFPITMPHFKEESVMEEIDLGVDEQGRNVSIGLRQYTKLLIQREVKLHTLIVLGSRAKGRSKPESDVDVIVIASNLPGKSSVDFLTIPQKFLNIRRRLLLSDAPLFLGVQPSNCGSKDEFMMWLRNFRLSALDAVYYGKVIYDDGFWKEVTNEFDKIEHKLGLSKTGLKKMLIPL